MAGMAELEARLAQLEDRNSQLEGFIRERLDVRGAGDGAPLMKSLGMPRRVGLAGCSPTRDEKIMRLSAVSPRGALAELTGAVRAPFCATVQAQFDTVSDTIASGDLDAQVIGGDTFIQDLVFDIQVPSAFAGNPLKTLYDFFYNKTSGIQAKISVTGRPRYEVVPNYTPLSNIADFVPGDWPDGWMLTRSNSLHMDFQPAIANLPFAPVTILVTFRGWQYVCENIEDMSIDAVFDQLKKFGYEIEELRSCRCDY